MSKARNLANFIGIPAINSSADATAITIDSSENATFANNVTAAGLTLTSTDAGSSAGPELILYRNSASPADADYIGQIQFKGRQDGPGDEIYAKVTGKITDASNGTEDGLIETAVKGNGSFTIVSRQKSDQLQLLNSVGLSVDGSVGIGTTSPQEKLHVYTTADARVEIESTTGLAAFKATNNQGSYAWYLDSSADKFHLYDFTDSTNRVTLDGDGKVGIGTTSPGKQLTINGADAEFLINRTGSYADTINMGMPSGVPTIVGGTDLAFGGTGTWTEHMRIKANGNVGIGTPSPAEALNIVGTGGTAKIRFDGDSSNLQNNFIGITGYDDLIIASDEANSGSASTIQFRVDASERMRITSDGRVGIGTTGPSFPLDLRAPSGGGDAVVRIHNQHTGSGDDAILRLSIAGTTGDSIIQFGDGGDADIGRIAYHHNGNTMRFFTGAAEEMRLENDGDLHVDGNVIAYSTTISDERLKDDVQDITGALDTVDALRGVTYTWNAGSREGKRDYGVIAQEVERVIPEIVHDTTMPLLGDEETVYKTVDYEKLCAVLINAVSELRAEVEALKNGASDSRSNQLKRPAH